MASPSDGPAPASGRVLKMGVLGCERGDIRYAPHGLYVYDEDGKREVPVEARRMVGQAEITELYDAVAGVKPVSHSGE